MNLGEALRFSYQSLAANKVRTVLTALGLVIGNASVILVVTISLTSRDYILDQIRAIGSNMIYASYEAGSMTATQVEADFVKLADVEAVRQQLGSRITAATGVMTTYDQLTIGGKQEDVRIIGSDDQYKNVRNLAVIAGRFMDANDVTMRTRVAMLTEKLARRLYGSQEAAVGQRIKLHELQFDVIGTFKERTSTFGLSELTDETILIPITVLRYFAPVERIDPLYVQARNTEDVVPLTRAVRQIIESRHRPGARYQVENLSGILSAAQNIALILTFVLIMVSAIALVISGIGIMNIMLVTVTERTREIGVRMAVGASRREVLMQFLLEAVLISVGGGLIGILAGVGLPLSVQLFVEEIRIPISWISIAVAFVVSLVVGLIFGLLPANRAARMNPTAALRYE
ncbi:MAG TPA: ABC transporter permease [Bryobacteraceae bacterium]|nr:ABC transporter permease [Bryobacteraceae bacterium]